MTIYEAARLAHLEWITSKGEVLKVDMVSVKNRSLLLSSVSGCNNKWAYREDDFGILVKPLMKSLDMMTDEQVRELFMIHTGKGETEFNSSIFRLFERNCRSVLYPFGFEAFNYLIQQGFDIFGYLDADIATIVNQ